MNSGCFSKSENERMSLIGSDSNEAGMFRTSSQPSCKYLERERNRVLLLLY